MRVLSSLLCAFAPIMALLSSVATAQVPCGGSVVQLSYRSEESRQTRPDGTELRVTEYSIGLCVDPEIKAEIVAHLQSGRQGLNELIAAIRDGRAAVRFVTKKAGDAGTTAVQVSRTAAASAVDLSSEAVSLLSAGAQWAWQVVMQPASAAPDPAKD
jgi:hypothetical protein